MIARKIRRALTALLGLACIQGCNSNQQSSTAPAVHSSVEHSVTPAGSVRYLATNLTTNPAPIPSAPGAPVAPVLLVPFVAKPVVPSSHFDVSVWARSVNTHTLLDANGKGAVPVSEARFLWDNRNLYVNFYAGDLDLEAHETKHDGAVWNDDSVTFAFFTPARKRLISVSATGVLSDGECPLDADTLADTRCNLHWESHARLGIDADGTVNHLHDFDEEWNVQLAIPLASLGARAASHAELSFTILRCEMAHDGPRACGRWGTSSEPGKLILE